MLLNIPLTSPSRNEIKNTPQVASTPNKTKYEGTTTEPQRYRESSVKDHRKVAEFAKCAKKRKRYSKEKVKKHANKPHQTKSPLVKGTTQRVGDFVQHHHNIKLYMKPNPITSLPHKGGEVCSNQPAPKTVRPRRTPLRLTCPTRDPAHAGPEKFQPKPLRQLSNGTGDR